MNGGGKGVACEAQDAPQGLQVLGTYRPAVERRLSSVEDRELVREDLGHKRDA
jgi:hypothetical protein